MAMRRHSLGALGTPVVVVSSFLMFACGASPHDRAEEVMQSAVERFSVLHARVDGVILAAEERGRGGCEGVDPVPNINLVLLCRVMCVHLCKTSIPSTWVLVPVAI